MPYISVRKVLPSEYGKYRKHLLSLDDSSKHLRFGYAITDEMINSFCDRFESERDKHVLFCIEDSNLDFIAIGHISLEGEMELAFSVLPGYQGQGLGNKLFKRVIQWCRTHDRLKGCMVCLSTNRVIKHLCLKYGIHIESDGSETLADIQLDRPDLATYVIEATDRNLAIMDYLNKRIARSI